MLSQEKEINGKRMTKKLKTGPVYFIEESLPVSSFGSYHLGFSIVITFRTLAKFCITLVSSSTETVLPHFIQR